MPVNYFNDTVLSTLANMSSSNELLNRVTVHQRYFRELIATFKSFFNSANLTNVVSLLLVYVRFMYIYFYLYLCYVYVHVLCSMFLLALASVYINVS